MPRGPRGMEAALTDAAAAEVSEDAEPFAGEEGRRALRTSCGGRALVASVSLLVSLVVAALAANARGVGSRETAPPALVPQRLSSGGPVRVNGCLDDKRPGDPYAVAIVFAGRPKYMRLLVAYLDQLVEDCSLDEVHVWNFTKSKRDWRWLQNVSASRPAFQFMEPALPEKWYPTEYTWQQDRWNFAHRFYAPPNETDATSGTSGTNETLEPRFMPQWSGATPNSTVLLKMDDDIVYIDTVGFPGFTRYVRDHPEKFIVHANIVNNPVTAYYQAHRIERLSKQHPELLKYPMSWAIPGLDGDLLLLDKPIVGDLHRMFISHLERFSWENESEDSCTRYSMPVEDFYKTSILERRFATWTLMQFKYPETQGRLCINFFGARWAAWAKVRDLVEEYGGVDEQALTVWATTKKHGLEECIYTPFNVAHYAFLRQRERGFGDKDLKLYEELLARKITIRSTNHNLIETLSEDLLGLRSN
ncbi:unnamed protein product [Prorocentrum cordatum]|uniref:Protein xylosyltransferase n=1 Tax=Prorocentrum cordatum TaxID=2364126 RepID=A0ABN9TPK3_9DINO|nr:unnamed protein product [Polarella glacialis]